ncbi:MAG: sigma-70 family RNA polymerase sigma factor [Erysipelotrichales bacterium]
MSNDEKETALDDSIAFQERIIPIYNELERVAYLNISNKDNLYDAIQEALIIAFNNINSLRNPEYFKTWLIRILINECYKINNKEKVYLNCNDNFIGNIADKRNIDQEVLSDNSFIDALNYLDEKYKIIMYLFYGEELKIKEISKILDINENTVKTRLSRGRNLLKEVYQKNMNE